MTSKRKLTRAEFERVKAKSLKAKSASEAAGVVLAVLERFVAQRNGRRPMGERALTNSEKQRRHRERVKIARAAGIIATAGGKITEAALARRAGVPLQRVRFELTAGTVAHHVPEGKGRKVARQALSNFAVHARKRG